MSQPLSQQELIELWLAAGDESLAEQGGDAGITDEQRELLNRLIVENPEVRQQLIALSQQQAWLMWHGKSDSDAIDINNVNAVVARVSALIGDTETNPAAKAPSLYGFLSDLTSSSASLLRPPMVLFTLLAVGFVGAAIAYFLTDSPVQQAVREVRIESTPVAYITSANGCDWGGPSPGLWRVGKDVQLGDELTLHEGIAEFHLRSGVSVSVEGPAALVVNSPSSLVVQHGKVTVYVPWSVTDFKMLASTCPITACDASFGVSIAGSMVDVHVFSGEVIVGSSPFDTVQANEWEYAVAAAPAQQEKSLPSGSEFSKARVTKGRGLQLSGTSGVMKVSRWHGAKASEFANKLSMAGRLPVNAAYVNAVLRSKPAGYWRFESQEEGRIVNQVAPSNDLIIVGNPRLIGDEENRVVEFGRSNSEGHLVSSKPLDELAGSDYSVELWMKPSHGHRGGLVGFAIKKQPEPNQPGPHVAHGFFLETIGALKPAALVEVGLKEPNGIRFLHRDPPGSDYRTGTSCFTQSPYAIRRWQHVAAVKKGSDMKLYVDGKLSGQAKDPSKLAKDLYLEVGQFIGSHDIFPFVGQVDELAIYNRALSGNEIRRHYKALQWSTKPPQPANPNDS